MWLFNHKLINKLERINTSHLVIKARGYLDSERKQIIMGAQLEVWLYLRPYALRWKPMPKLFQEQDPTLLKEAYEKCDFNWTNQKKYFEFQKWLIERLDKIM